MVQYQQQLEAQAHENGVADRVKFLGFWDDVSGLLAATDIVVHTSVAPEPFGRVIVEGMPAGKPVVAMRAKGAREIIQHDNTGILVPPGDPSELAGTLKAFFASNPERQRSGKAAQYVARKRFSVEEMICATKAEIDLVAPAINGRKKP